MKRNDYFEAMIETMTAYVQARDAREEKREALMNEGNWDAVKEMDEKEETELPKPFTAGEAKALNQYRRSTRDGADAFEISDLPWNYELTDYVKTLRAAGITTAVVTDESTALMDGIYGLANLGCRMAGLQTVTRENDHRFGSKEPVRKNGIAFEIR